MNGDTIKEFLVGLGFDIQGEGKFDAAVGKATVLAVGLGAAAVAAATGIFALTAEVADYFDNLGDMSNRTDIAVGDIEEFGYVALLTGSSIEAANASLESFSKTAGDAANGMGRGKKVFDSLGVSVEDSNGKLKNTTDLLYEVGDKIKDLDKGKQIAVLERLGLDKTLVDALTTDVGGLRDEFRKLYDAAGIDSAKAAENAGAFNDSLDRLKYVLSTVGRALAIDFFGRFTEALDSLRKLIVDSLPAILRVLKPIISSVLLVADVFVALAYRAGQAVAVVIGWVADVVGAMNKWVLGIGLVVAAWKYLNLSFLLTPIGAILALGVAVGLIIDDFMTWKEGGDSLIPWSDWAPELELISNIVDVLRTALEHCFMYLFNVADAVIKLFSGDFSGAVEHLKAGVEELLMVLSTLFGPALDIVGEKFRTTFDSIKGFVGSVIDYIKSLIAGFGETVDAVLGKIRAGVDMAKGLKDGVADKASGVVDWVKGAAGKVGDIFGSPEAGPTTQLGADGGLQTAVPLPAQQQISQETTINVQGSADPQATGRAVQGQQEQVNGDMARNLKGAVR